MEGNELSERCEQKKKREIIQDLVEVEGATIRESTVSNDSVQVFAVNF